MSNVPGHHGAIPSKEPRYARQVFGSELRRRLQVRMDRDAISANAVASALSKAAPRGCVIKPTNLSEWKCGHSLPRNRDVLAVFERELGWPLADQLERIAADRISRVMDDYDGNEVSVRRWMRLLRSP